MPYLRPHTVDDVIESFAGRVLDLLGLDTADLERWQGLRRES
jgi:3-polyprenyl-4-hydroxybenzoate decarboxylase